MIDIHKIAIIEDDMVFVKLLTKIISDHSNSEIRNYDMGTKALRDFEFWKPEVIFLDVNLNGLMDGRDILDSIKDICPLAKVYVVSSNEKQHVQTDLETLGNDGYIAKDDNVLENVKLAVMNSLSAKSA